MGQVVSGLLGGKAPGPSAEMLAAQQRQSDAADAREAETKAQTEARRRALFGRGAGRVSLISGDETGVQSKLGG